MIRTHITVSGSLLFESLDFAMPTFFVAITAFLVNETFGLSLL